MGKLLAPVFVFLLSCSPAFAGATPGETVPAERRELTPEALRPLAEHFGDKQRTYRSPHFVLIYDTDGWRARSHTLLLERTHDQFYQAFEAAGFELEPLRQHLVCLLFGDETDFIRYGQAVDYMDLSWTGGYYSARTNRVALYQRGWPERRPGADADAEPDLAHDEADDDSGRPRLRLSALEPSATDGRPHGLASTIHEAAHQLAFNSGLQTRGVMYPLWVSEGLAISFETHRPSEPFGPGHVNEARRHDLQQARAAGQLVPLDRFVRTVRPPSNDPAMVRVVYAQSWALFHHLFTHAPEALHDYLRRLADLPRGQRSPRTLEAEFVDAFGPLEAVEADWQAYLDELAGE